jgi:diacylglycerol kinase family enzyme
VTRSLEDLSRVAREFKERGISILAINGGDGTLCRTLTAFIHEYGGQPLPQIAALRGGTINVLASNLGIKGSPEEVLYRLVEAHAAGGGLHTRKVTTIKVEDNYGFLFGNGVAATFLNEYYRNKTGPVGAAMWVLGVWGSRFVGGELHYRVVKDIPVALSADGEPPIAHSTCAIFTSTLERMPLGYPLFEALPANPGKFQMVSFTFAAKDAIWKLPIIMLKRKEGSTTGKLTYCARSLRIESDAPFDYTLDGELYVSRSHSLMVQTGPELEFVSL